MNNKLKAIVLGGTIPHIELIKNLQKRGYYTILIDYYDNPPAAQVADEHIKESTLDKEKVLEIAQLRKVDLVISACIDHANVTACYVGEKLGLPIPYSYQTSLDVSNKVLMKKKMVEGGIPTANHCVVKEKSELDNISLSFPLIIKPVDSNSAKGVRKVNNYNELNNYFEDAKNISRTGDVIVEEFIEGVEISVYSFIQDNTIKFIMMSQRFSLIDGNQELIKCFATMTPPFISKQVEIKIEIIANQIANAFELENTPLHFEVIVNKDEVYVIELTPRVGGGLSFRTIYLNSNFDIINSTINSFLGIYDCINYKLSNQCFAINILYANPGIFDRIEGNLDLIDKNIIEELYSYKTNGMTIDPKLSSSSRIGAFIVRGNNYNDLFKKIEHAIQHLEVFDANNKKILRKDLFLNENNYKNNLQKN